MHRHESTVGIIDCTVDKAGDQTAKQQKRICPMGVYLHFKVLSKFTSSLDPIARFDPPLRRSSRSREVSPIFNHDEALFRYGQASVCNWYLLSEIYPVEFVFQAAGGTNYIIIEQAYGYNSSYPYGSM